MRDRLYQNPLEVGEPSEVLTAYFDSLGFTRLVEQLGLRTVPLPSLQYWLSKPKGANLVEARVQDGDTEMAVAYRSLAIAVSGETLYSDNCPLVGVGIVYTPPYLRQITFSDAYMNLNEWCAAPEASEQRLVGTRLMFIQVSGSSGFFPVPEKHPVFLDAASTKAK